MEVNSKSIAGNIKQNGLFAMLEAMSTLVAMLNNED